MHAHKFTVIPVILLAACLFLAGCAGSSRFPAITDPVSLLPENAEMYAGLSVRQNTALIESVIVSAVPEEQSDSVRKMVPSADFVYAAFDNSDGNASLVIQGDFPVHMIPLVFTAKNGWHKIRTKVASVPVSISYYSHDNGIHIAFPSKSLCIVSSSSESVVDAIKKLYMGEAALSSDMNSIAGFFNQYCTEEFSFAVFSASPDALVAAILGPRISFGIDTIGLQLAPGNDALVYNGNVLLTLLDARVRPAALFILKAVLFAAMPGSNQYEIEIDGDTGILLKNITISPDSMIELIGSGISHSGL